MANQLRVAVVHAIEVLWERGWSQRRIAGVLGVDRGTVAGYARSRCPSGREPANPAKAPPGSDGASTKPAAVPGGIGVPSRGTSTDSKPANEASPGATGPQIESPDGSGGLRSVAWGLHSARPTGVTTTDGVAEAPSGPRPASQTSQCEPFRAVIKGQLDKGLTARRIHQDLFSEYGFEGKYHSVRRFVRRLGQTRPLPFRRMECEPGEEAQVDFGTGAPILQPNGKRRRTHVFRIVLSHSRKGFSEAVFKQSTESFIGALENAFRHFGGVPKTLVQDELAIRSERRINRRVKAAAFRQLKPLVNFDFAFNPSIKKKQVYDLATCRFIREVRDVLILGPPGTGKSFLVQALGYQAIKAGFTVLYRSIFDLVRDFLHDEAFAGYDKVLMRYLKPDLVIIDDFGMKHLPKRSGEYFFEIIMRRYET